MFLKPRPNTFTLYRLFFVCLLLLLGICGLTASLLVYLDPAWLLAFWMPGDSEAFMVAGIIGGSISLLYGSLLLHMISDRRYHQVAIDFPDRRMRQDHQPRVSQGQRASTLPGYPRYQG